MIIGILLGMALKKHDAVLVAAADHVAGTLVLGPATFMPRCPP